MKDTTNIHICQFSTTDHLEGKKRTYEAVKAAVLEAGKFSVFEATESPFNARQFARLQKDPEVEFYRLRFPWMGVRRKPSGS